MIQSVIWDKLVLIIHTHLLHIYLLSMKHQLADMEIVVDSSYLVGFCLSSRLLVMIPKLVADHIVIGKKHTP